MAAFRSLVVMVEAANRVTFALGEKTSTSSPTETVPLVIVPVTTTPAPLTVKDRSTHILSGPSGPITAMRDGSGELSLQVFHPDPDTGDTGTTGHPSRAVPSLSRP